MIGTLSWLLTPALRDAVFGGGVLYMSLGYFFLLEPLLKRTSWVTTQKGAYRGHMVVYNLLMCIFSLACFVCCIAALGMDPGGVLQPLRDLTGDKPAALYTNECASLFDSKLFLYTGLAFHYSKYVEYMDTAWLVLKGKPVSFLQKFHHFGAAWDTYFGLVFKNEGLYVFVLLNSFVHTIMYAYYAATAAGIKITLKPLITVMQIVQFFYGFAIVYPYINIPCFRESPELVASYIYNYFYVGTVLLLFGHFFYNDNFVKKSLLRPAAKPAKKD